MNTVTADECRRVTLPNCNPGDRFAVMSEAGGLIVLKRMLEPSEGIPVVRPIWDGNLLIAPTAPSEPLDYAALIRQERDSQ